MIVSEIRTEEAHWGFLGDAKRTILDPPGGEQTHGRWASVETIAMDTTEVENSWRSDKPSFKGRKGYS
jgi:hypothetical protein